MCDRRFPPNLLLRRFATKEALMLRPTDLVPTDETTTLDPTSGAPAPLTDTSDMYCIHAVFREALDRAPSLLSGATSDSDHADAVAVYYDTVLRLLHAHHEGEDEMLTPLLEHRCSGEELSAVRRIAAQHQPVSASLHRATEQLSAWRAAPDPRSAEALRTALGDVQQALIPHLDEEERVVLPIAARHVTPEEWGALPGHAMRQFGGADLWLVLGLVFDHMPDDLRAAVQAHMPPPLLAAWTADGQPHYESFRSRLNG
jgi:iron-sulfur cluster repair protein YtfE (RIC family)